MARPLPDVLRDVVGDRVQDRVAEAIGVTGPALSRWLRHGGLTIDNLKALLGACAPDPALVVETWEAFGADPDVLATADDIAARRRLQAEQVVVGP